MRLQPRVNKLESKKTGGEGLWGECNSLAKFCVETWGGEPPAPGTQRLQLAMWLSAVPTLLDSAEPEFRQEALEGLELTPEQAENAVEVDRRILEIAIAEGLSQRELKVLRRWVAKTRADVKKWQALDLHCARAAENRES